MINRTKAEEREWVRGQVEKYAHVFHLYRQYSEVLREVLEQAAKRYAPHAVIQTRAKSIASFAEKIYEPIIGSNYRLSELHAAVAIEQLKKIDIFNQPRLRLANYLTQNLKKFNWLKGADVLKNSTHAYYVYPIKFFKEKIGFSRQTFASAMAAEGFPLNQGYLKPLYLMPAYQRREIYPGTHFPFSSKEFKVNVNYKPGLCPVTERLFYKEFLLTAICNHQRTKKDIDLFIKAIKKIEENAEELKKYETGR